MANSWVSLSRKNIVYLLTNFVLILLGVVFIRAAGNISVSIGASLLATGITGWVLFIYVRIDESQRSLISLLNLFGFVKAFDARGVRIKAEYDARLVKARDRIDIMGFGLRALREDYREQFAQWKTQAKVRVLVIDPDFPNVRNSYARQRDKEEKCSEGTIQADVDAFLAEKSRTDSTGRPESFEVRMYTCLPSINILRIDDELFWGPYLVSEPSRNTPTFLVRRGGVLFEKLVEHFDRIWNDSALSHPPAESPEARDR